MRTRVFTLTTICFFLTFNSFAQNLVEFKSILNDCGMKFEVPEGFIEAEITENDDMNYEYAVKYPDRDFILRYAVRPITYKIYANDTVRNELESQKGFRNSAYGTIFMTVMYNITGGKEYEVQSFDPVAVKEEFNADWGAFSFVELNSEFGENYKYCFMVSIHKKDVADAYYFYMSDTKENFSENMEPLFHSLKFE